MHLGLGLAEAGIKHAQVHIEDPGQPEKGEMISVEIHGGPDCIVFWADQAPPAGKAQPGLGAPQEDVPRESLRDSASSTASPGNDAKASRLRP
ncbi:hypothetical protein AZSP09_08130 [Azospira sp. I09]|nr:hypothetical protein AZSP09_08130 [Azospira sp. I09]